MAEVTRVRVELQEQIGRLQAELMAQETLKEKVAALERQLKGELSPGPPRAGSAGPVLAVSSDRLWGWQPGRGLGLSLRGTGTGSWVCLGTPPAPPGLCVVVFSGQCPDSAWQSCLTILPPLQ